MPLSSSSSPHASTSSLLSPIPPLTPSPYSLSFPTTHLHSTSSIYHWSEHDVAQWLKENSFSQYVHLFLENDVNGVVLLELDNELLKDMPIKTVGERVKLILAIRSLRRAYRREYGGDPEHDQYLNTSLSEEYSPRTPLPHKTFKELKGPDNYRTPATRYRSEPFSHTHSGNLVKTRNNSVGNLGSLTRRPTTISQQRPLNPRPDAIYTDIPENILFESGDRSDHRKTGLFQPPEMVISVPLSPMAIKSTSSLREANVSRTMCSSGGIMSMASVKQRCIRVAEDDGQFRIIKLAKSDLEGSDHLELANHIMSEIFRKFNVDKADRPLYALYVKENSENSDARQLDVEELVQICFSPNRPEKEWLILRKLHAHDSFKRKGTIKDKLRKLEMFYGETPSTPAVSASPIHSPDKTRLFGERARPPSELITADLSKYFNGYRSRLNPDRRPASGVPDGAVTNRSSLSSTRSVRKPSRVPLSLDIPLSNANVTNKWTSRTEDEISDSDKATSSAEPNSTIDDYIVDPGASYEAQVEVDDNETGSEGAEEKVPVITEIAAPASSHTGTIKWIEGDFIGKGSFGSVCLGLNPRSGELMAVKQVELPTNSSANEERKKSMLDALQREINLLKGFEHENIVRYIGSQITSTHLNIFLEYVPGGSVAGLLSSYGAFEEPLIRTFVKQILQGLAYLHERDIIHRDIKGGNILVDNKGCVKISDFGISKKVEDSVNGGGNTLQRASLAGSVFWMAPEVVKQTPYTQKADIWSLGCLVVEMFTGKHPFPQYSQMQAMFKIGSCTCPEIPEGISEAAQNFLAKTFETDSTKRPSANELLSHPFLDPMEDD